MLPNEACGDVYKRIVLTGGPGAGKTAALELARLHVCEHVAILPESASMLFQGRFPRSPEPEVRRAAQRAIYHVQRELETATAAMAHVTILLCDRGTVDGAAYWPGPDTLWSAVGTTRDAEIARYDTVIHMRTPERHAYNHDNPVRIETSAEAARIDARIAEVWSGHPNYAVVPSTESFVTKAEHALSLILAELPRCCPKTHAAHRFQPQAERSPP